MILELVLFGSGFIYLLMERRCSFNEKCTCSTKKLKHLALFMVFLMLTLSVSADNFEENFGSLSTNAPNIIGNIYSVGVDGQYNLTMDNVYLGQSYCTAGYATWNLHNPSVGYAYLYNTVTGGCSGNHGLWEHKTTNVTLTRNSTILFNYSSDNVADNLGQFLMNFSKSGVTKEVYLMMSNCDGSGCYPSDNTINGGCNPAYLSNKSFPSNIADWQEYNFDMDKFYRVCLLDNSTDAYDLDAMTFWENADPFNKGTGFDRILVTSGYPTTSGNDIPHIVYINHSATLINLNPTAPLVVSALAEDDESDDIYWAYTCDYQGESGTQRIQEEYFNSGSNMTEIKRKFNLPNSCVNSFGNVFEVDSLVGYAWNLSQSDCVTSFKLNASNGAGVSSNLITVHFMTSVENLLTSDSMFIAGEDGSGNPMWAMYYVRNESNPSGTRDRYYVMNSSLDFTTIDTNSNLYDRIMVDMDMDAQLYRVRIDEGFDGSIDFTSTWYSMLPGLHNTFRDVLFFTAGGNPQEDVNYADLSATSPTGDQWIDSVYIETSDLPLFSVLPSDTYLYNCNYTTIGNYDVRTYVTDLSHFNNYTSFNSQNINVVQLLNNCIGYTDPSCTGNCFFYDDFSYSNPVSCNLWSGLASGVVPISGVFRINNNPTQYAMEVDTTGILENEYADFTFSFDFNLKNTDTLYFTVLNSELSKYSVYVRMSNYEVSVYTPTKYTLGTVAPNTVHNLRGVVNLQNDKIDWYLDNVFIYQGAFYDGVQTSARQFGFLWDITSVFDLDNFTISGGSAGINPNATVYEPVDYVYNPSMFCAINWSSTSQHKFSQENCEARGFATNPNLVSLCPIRACFQDLGLGIVAWAMQNLIATIIIVVAFILVAPLVVALIRK